MKGEKRKGEEERREEERKIKASRESMMGNNAHGNVK